MTKKPTEKQKAFAKKCGQYARDILLLNSYGLSWVWCEEDDVKEDGCSRAASISTDLKYKELTINMFLVFWEEIEYRQFEIIFHEFCHVHTEQQYMNVIHLLRDKIVTVRECEEKREHETALFEKSFLWLLGDPKRYKETADFIKKLSNKKVRS